MNYAKFLTTIILIFVSLGFRLEWKNNMNATKADPNLYIKVCSDITDQVIEENDTDSSDPLYGQENLNTISVLNSIVDDYNAVTESFMRLVIYDETLHGEIADDKVIELYAGSTKALASSGEASVKNGGGCEIVFQAELFDYATHILGTLTHELGHCAGLGHPHEQEDLSVMSYFAGADIYRLQIDDKLGLIHLYPTNKLNQRNSFGLSCQPE
jgi:hypothetical protein